MGNRGSLLQNGHIEWATWSPIEQVPQVLWLEVMQLGTKLTMHLHLLLSGAIPLPCSIYLPGVGRDLIYYFHSLVTQMEPLDISFKTHTSCTWCSYQHNSKSKWIQQDERKTTLLVEWKKLIGVDKNTKYRTLLRYWQINKLLHFILHTLQLTESEKPTPKIHRHEVGWMGRPIISLPQPIECPGKVSFEFLAQLVGGWGGCSMLLRESPCSSRLRFSCSAAIRNSHNIKWQETET